MAHKTAYEGGANRRSKSRYLIGADSTIAKLHHGSLATETDVERALHAGSLYLYFDYDDSFDTGDGRKMWLVRVGDSEEIHSWFYASGTEGLKLDIFESPTWTDKGTAEIVYNRNRNNTTVPEAVNIYKTPTISDDGTRLERIITGAKRQSGSGVSSEFMLKPNTDYLFTAVTVANGNTCDFEIQTQVEEEGAAPTTTTTT